MGGTKQPYFKIQTGVKLREMKPQIQLALDRVIAVFFKNGFPAIVTSLWRATSPTFSLHLFGYAVDVDTDRSLPDNIWKGLSAMVKEELGVEYDVMAHDVGQGMHLHVEWDPKLDEEWQNVEQARLYTSWSTSRRG
jgi:hypothetical protein